MHSIFTALFILILQWYSEINDRGPHNSFQSHRVVNMIGCSSPFPLKRYPAALLGGVHFTSINMRFFNLHSGMCHYYKTDIL